jgi:hypothetical protein
LSAALNVKEQRLKQIDSVGGEFCHDVPRFSFLVPSAAAPRMQATAADPPWPLAPSVTPGLKITVAELGNTKSER